MCVTFKLVSNRTLIMWTQDEVHFRVNFDKFNVHIRNSVRQIGYKSFFFASKAALPAHRDGRKRALQ
jgi:hypothetical protein